MPRPRRPGARRVARNPQDGWAVHAVAHVMEMQGRADEGAAFMNETAPGWSPDSMFAYHNWWHMALFCIDRGDIAGALRLFDERVSAGGFGQALEAIDGSALLWRLWVLGHDVGDRWARVAPAWSARIAHGIYAFNDVHAMMAFAATGDRAAQRGGDRHARTRGGGAGHERDDVARCRPAAGPRASPPSARATMPGRWRISCRSAASPIASAAAMRSAMSIHLTALEAAIRAGDRGLARALADQRLAQKPHSPFNLGAFARANALAAA